MDAYDRNFVQFYYNTKHTSGDIQPYDLSMYFSGAGGSGETLKVASTVNNVTVATTGSVNGAHVKFDATGASAGVTGSANALQATFGIDATADDIGGTCSVIHAETDLGASVTIPDYFAFISCTDAGTEVAQNLLRIPDVDAATDGLFCAHTTQTMTHSIKFVSADGTDYYLMCTDANTNRTES